MSEIADMRSFDTIASDFRRSRLRGLALSLVFALAVLVPACTENSAEAPGTQSQGQTQTDSRPVRVMTVEDAVSRQTRRFSGRVKAVQTVDLSFQVDGELIKLPVFESQRVPMGELIAALDPTDYERQVREATVRRDLAQQKLDRVQQLRRRDVASQESLDNAKAEYDLAAVALDTAKRNLAYTEIRAPFDALITRRLVDNFTFLQAGTQVVRIQDVSEVRVDINVPEALFSAVRRNEVEKIEVIFPAFPEKRFPLSFRENQTEADPVTQTYPVTLGMAPPEDLNILPGMTASVEVQISRDSSQAGGLIVPTSAIAADADKHSYVWLFDAASAKVSKRPVSVGRIRGDFALVTSGIEPGDKIVTAGVSFLVDGQTVRAID
jgi:RND family efflux transporter MFP subunit